MHRRNFIKAGAIIPIAAGVSASSAFSYPVSSQISPDVIKKLKDKVKPITPEERAQRREHARKLMAENKMDVVLMEGGTSLNYFSGAQWGRSERLFAMLLFQKGDPVFIAPAFEEGRAKEQTGNAKLFTWQEDQSPYELIKEILSDAGLANNTIGIEETTRYFVTDNIQKTIPGVILTSATPVTAGCRSVKTPHEIELMQIANDMAAEVYKVAVTQLKEGMGERELGSIITSLFAEFGVEGGALVLFGASSALPHGSVKEAKLREGDIVLIDGGCSLEHYESDITRTTVFGKPTDKMNAVWNIVRQAQDAALKKAKPGVEASHVDAAARIVINQSGYGSGYKYFTHRVGHGIGMDGHEWHYLVGSNHKPLQPGNMFSNEPGIYIPGEFGIRLEDEMLITVDGAKLLLPQAQSLEKIF